MSDIQAQLLLRTFWLTIANPALTKAQAKEIAAEQLAQEEQERRTAQRQQAKPRPRPRQPRTPDATDASSAPGALLSKIFGILDRVHDRLHAPKPAAPSAASSTSSTHPGREGDRRVHTSTGTTSTSVHHDQRRPQRAADPGNRVRARHAQRRDRELAPLDRAQRRGLRVQTRRRAWAQVLADRIDQ